MKLKDKTQKNTNYLKIAKNFSLFLVLLFVICAFGAQKVYAACTDAPNIGDGIYDCDASSVNLTISPNPFKIGDTVTFGITVNDNLGPDASTAVPHPLTDRKSFEVDNDKVNVYVLKQDVAAGSGGAFTASQIITTRAFPTAGSYKITPAIIYYQGATDGNLVMLRGPALTVQVGAAVSTGAPSLQLSNPSISFGASTDPKPVLAHFSFSYLDGGTNQQAGLILYYCDYKGAQTTETPQGVSPSVGNFNCSYPSTAANYTVFAKAVSGSNPASAVTLASSNTSAVQVTGNEASQGPATASGGGDINFGIAGLITKILVFIAGLIQEFIYAVFWYLIAPVIQAMLSIHPYTDTFVAVIYPGWEIVRNICNIFFILALIVIALATLFRVESYQYRHLLVQLIIAALLINFSLVIGQAILGLADTVQSQFLPANVTVVRSLAGDLMVKSYRDEFWSTSIINGQWADVVKPLFFLALSLGSFAVFCAIAVFLVIRIVALWILLLISPIAYACGVLPSTASYRSTWWQNFLKYAFFTPIMAFFLNLAAVISNKSQTNPILQAINADSLQKDLGDSSLATFVFRIASNILILIFLVAALKVAEQAGVYGAAGITSMAEKGIFAPFALAGKGLKAAGNRGLEAASDVAGVELDPRVWKHEMDEYLKKRKKDRQLAREERKFGKTGVPTGSPRDMLENYANWKGVNRVWKAAKAGGHAKVMTQMPELEDRAKMLTDTEVGEAKNDINNKTLKLANQNALKDNLEKDVLSNMQAKKIRDELIKEAGKQTAERARLTAVRNALATSGKSTTEVDKQITAANAQIASLLGDARKIQTDIASGATEVDMKSVINGESGKFLKESGTFDKDKELSQLNAEIGKTTGDIASKSDVLTEDGKKKNKHLGSSTASWSQGQKDQATKAYGDMKKLSEEIERPEAYYARAARIAREDEESKKISKIHDEGELNKLLRNARRQGDKPKAIAILKKLTRDRNINETLEDENLPTTFEGARKLLTKIGDELKMTHHELMEVSTEIGYEAEESKQYPFARMTWIDPETGHLEWNGYTRDPNTHALKGNDDIHRKHVLTEMRKSEPRKRFGDLPRWDYVVEQFNTATGQRETIGFQDTGPDLLFDAVGNQEALRNLRSQGNTKSMKAVTEVPNWENELIKAAVARGISAKELQQKDGLIESIKTAAGK